MNTSTELEGLIYPRLARVIVTGGRAVLAAARQSLAAWRQRRKARQTLHALARLDARTLRDLGFHRSEILSVAPEVLGEAEITRARLC